MNRAVIEERIHAAIRPQLDRCDELLDYYLADAPPEVWEPIAFKVAADHYGTPPFPPIVGSFADAVDRMDTAIRHFAQLLHDPSMTADLYWKHP